MANADYVTTDDPLTIERAIALSEHHASLRVCSAEQLEILSTSGWHVLAAIPTGQGGGIRGVWFLLGRHEDDTITALRRDVETLRQQRDQATDRIRQVEHRMLRAEAQLHDAIEQNRLKNHEIQELRMQMTNRMTPRSGSVVGLWKP